MTRASIDEAEAVALVAASRALIGPRELGEAQELRQGWYFPTRAGDRTVGCYGVIVNRQTGKLFHLGSAYPLELGFDLYDRGYQFEVYDLTVVGVRDRKATLKTLTTLTRLEASPLSKDELAGRLERLPLVVARLHFCADTAVLEKARGANWFTFELTECGPRGG